MSEILQVTPPQGGVILIGGQAQTDHFDVPTLFPQWPRYSANTDDLRDYIEQALVQMAQEKTLYVTYLVNQGALVRDTVGMVLKGIRIDEEKRMAAVGHIQPELAGYPVRIRSVDGRSSIRYKRGKVSRRYLTKKNCYLGEEGFSNRLYLYDDVWVDMQAPECTLPLPDAWICLTQHGKHCRPAKRTGLQAKYWLYEELLPEGLAQKQDEPAPERKRASR